jgi:hypothetical protein
MKKYFKIMRFACLILCSVYAVTCDEAGSMAGGMAGAMFAGLLITCGCCFVIRESYKKIKGAALSIKQPLPFYSLKTKKLWQEF